MALNYGPPTSGPCTSASQVAGTTGMHHQIQLSFVYFAFLGMYQRHNHFSNIGYGFNFMCAYEKKNNFRILTIYSETLPPFFFSSTDPRVIKKCYMAEMGKR
jgi:hypothetical protein